MFKHVVFGTWALFVVTWFFLTLVPHQSSKPAPLPRSPRSAIPHVPKDVLPRNRSFGEGDGSNVPEQQFSATGGYLKALANVNWWVSNFLTDDNFNILHAGPATPRTVALVSNMPGADYSKGNVSLGNFKQGLIFCEFWTATYPMFLLDCLPRFLGAFDLLKANGHIGDPNFMIFCPGMYFILQFLVEVFGVPEEQIVLMPQNLLWDFKYPNFYLRVERLWYAPMRWDVAQNARLVRQAVLQHVLHDRSPQRKDATPLVLFSERADMTMPRNFKNFSSELQQHLRHQRLSFQTGRLETLRVRTLLSKLQDVAAFVGPSGWGNAVNLLFLSPTAVVVEMFASRSTIVRSRPLNLMRTVDQLEWVATTDPFENRTFALLREKQQEATETLMTMPVSSPLVTDGRPESTLARWLASLFNLTYVAVYAEREVQPQLQPVFNTKQMASVILGTLDIRDGAPARNPIDMPLFLSPPLLGCENLFHKSKYPIQKGLFKQVHLTPDFALKLPRTGDWKRLAKEMLMLRNLSEPQITPAVSLCFDRPMYAQASISALGHQGQVKAERLPNPEQFYIAIAGFLRVWYSHETRGAFLFYCDPGPKNWGIPKAGEKVLQMYDLDTSAIVLPGSLCAHETHCGCEFTPEAACVDNRCTRRGMQRKINKQVHGWMKVLIVMYAPRQLLRDPETANLIQRCKRGPILCDDIKAYIRSKAPTLYGDLPRCEGRVLSEDWSDTD
eukprot:EG_transcript_4726